MKTSALPTLQQCLIAFSMMVITYNDRQEEMGALLLNSFLKFQLSTIGNFFIHMRDKILNLIENWDPFTKIHFTLVFGKQLFYKIRASR